MVVMVGWLFAVQWIRLERKGIRRGVEKVDYNEKEKERVRKEGDGGLRRGRRESKEERR